MMKLIVVVVMIMLLGVNFSFAQRSGTIQGVVSDRASGERVPFATISLLKDAGSLPLGTVSDDEGVFRLENLAYGTYDELGISCAFNTNGKSGKKWRVLSGRMSSKRHQSAVTFP